ncbi:hypothetical protein ACOSP7_001793 [Xanthoceras sorbifolium]
MLSLMMLDCASLFIVFISLLIQAMSVSQIRFCSLHSFILLCISNALQHWVFDKFSEAQVIQDGFLLQQSYLSRLAKSLNYNFPFFLVQLGAAEPSNLVFEVSLLLGKPKGTEE